MSDVAVLACGRSVCDSLHECHLGLEHHQPAFVFYVSTNQDVLSRQIGSLIKFPDGPDVTKSQPHQLPLLSEADFNRTHRRERNGRSCLHRNLNNTLQQPSFQLFPSIYFVVVVGVGFNSVAGGSVAVVVNVVVVFGVEVNGRHIIVLLCAFVAVFEAGFEVGFVVLFNFICYFVVVLSVFVVVVVVNCIVCFLFIFVFFTLIVNIVPQVIFSENTSQLSHTISTTFTSPICFFLTKYAISIHSFLSKCFV